jgi:hypothetical protein
MAIVQISQIKHRRGTEENLPQLASAELGWSVDSQKLYIGNGSIEEGAPVIGNTRILTTDDMPFANSEVFSAPTLNDNTVTTANIAALIFSISNPVIQINYGIQRGTNFRMGTLKITQYENNLTYDDNYTETSDIGVNFSVTQSAYTAQVGYTTTSTGDDASMKYSVNYFTWP